jgi:hypothetical protein
MPTFLQAVELPNRCFLQEVLFWVAFQRLPIAQYTEGKDLRETTEVGEYAVDYVDNFLSDEEARRAGIPIDPRWPLHPDEKVTLPVEHFDELLAKFELDPEVRADIKAGRESAIEYQRDVETWRPYYERAIEYPASRIFIALRSGELTATSRQLPARESERALAILKQDGRDVFDLKATTIPPAFWSLQGINFDASAAANETEHYCHVSFLTTDVLSVFPGEREQVTGISRVGDVFVLDEKTKAALPASRRGRPPYPWEAFHLEIAELLRRGELPHKKEAAIEHFQGWFLREHGVTASRSVIGQKLKPYYDRFIKGTGQKSSS